MNFLLGAQNTLEILTFRWRSIKTRGIRAVIIIGVLFGAGVIYSLAGTGNLIRYAASTGASIGGSSYTSVVLGYVKTFTVNDSVYAITGVLVALLGATLFFPLFGYSFSGLIPAGDMISVRKNDYHLITDSIVLQFLSSISIIQIFFITLLNAILTLESPRPGLGIIAGWGIWLLVMFVTVLVAWSFEYLHRRFGSVTKYASLGGVLAIAGVFVLLFPKQATSIFGLSHAYGSFIRGLDDLNTGGLILVGLGYLAAYVIVCFLVYQVASRVLNLQEKPRRKPFERLIVIGRNRRRITLTGFLGDIVIHQKNIIRPLIFALASVTGSTALFGGGETLSFLFVSLSLLIPLIVSLSWGVNTFGIIGGGTTWLMSLPEGKQKILRAIAIVQFVMILVMDTIIMLPEIILYHPSWAQLASFFIASLTVAAYMTRSAIAKAVLQPERYRVHIRGEQVLPPGKALAYLIRLAFAGSILSILSLGLVAQPLLQLALLLLVILWQVVRFHHLEQRWREEPEVIENIIKSVGY